MEKDEIKTWIKLHQEEIFEELVEAARVEPDTSPSGIFMAGLPGAGKTELSKRLLTVTGVKAIRIDMDELAEKLPDYAPERADNFRFGATLLLTNLFDFTLKNHYNFLMDGTFGSKNALLNIERALRRRYEVRVVYVFQDPRLAWNFTLARQKIEHRAITFNGFVEAYYNTLKNLKLAKEAFGNDLILDVIVKTAENYDGAHYADIAGAELDEIVHAEYNKNKLIEYIKGRYGTEESETSNYDARFD